MQRSVGSLRRLSALAASTRSFATKAHVFPNPLPYYPYPKPDLDLDADDWDTRPFENYEAIEVPSWENANGNGWVRSGEDPRLRKLPKGKKFVDIFAPKPSFIYTRTKPYALKKGYTAKRLGRLFQDSAWMVVIQCNYSHSQFLDFEMKLSEVSQGRIRLKSNIKNSMASMALKDSQFKAMSPLFNGPTVIAYSYDMENLLPDLHKFLDTCPAEEVLLLGAKIQDAVAEWNQIRQLKDISSLDSVVFNLIMTLQQPLNDVIRTLQNPQTNLVKTLDFQLKQLQPEEAAAAEAEA